MPLTSPVRLARTAAFAVVCLGLGVLAHVLGGGSVTPSAAAWGLAAALGAAPPLTARERTIHTILPLLAGVQVALHLLFSLSSPTACPAGVPPAYPHAGLSPALGMLLLHGWAAVLTSLWLARGEAALWALLRRLAVRFLFILRRPVPPVPPSPPPCADEPGPALPAVPRHAVTRRGPPLRVVPA